MQESKTFILIGLSQRWGKGGRRYPPDFAKEGFHYMPLDNKTLSPKEYFQYNSVRSDDYAEIFIVHDLSDNILKCVKCDDTSQRLDPCGNCGSNTDLEWSLISARGLYCHNCLREHQQSHWKCFKCNCVNSISNTLSHRVEIQFIPGKKEENCFVATACYGDFNSKEVLALRQFRDEKLRKTFLGKWFIKFYYVISPYCASQISKSEVLKTSIRRCFLNPVVNILLKKR